MTIKYELGYIDDDSAMTSNSDHLVSSQKATKTALATKEPTITAGTTVQYWRGDKSFQTLDKSAVGLGNVDNTSDASKPVSTATQTALDTKSTITSTISTTAQTTDIGSTNITTTGAGLYRLAYYLVDSTADLTAGAVRLNVTYTDAGTAQTQNSATVALTILGTFTQGEFIIQLASGNIVYSTTHTGIFGSAKYNLYISLERLI